MRKIEPWCIFGILEENRIVRVIFVARRALSFSLVVRYFVAKNLTHAHFAPSVLKFLFLSDPIRRSQTAGNDGRPFFWPSVLKSNFSFSPSYFYHSDTRCVFVESIIVRARYSLVSAGRPVRFSRDSYT